MTAHENVIASAVLAGALSRDCRRASRSSTRARVAAERGIEVVESRSTRAARLHARDLGQAAQRDARALGRGDGVRAGEPAARARSTASPIEAPLDGHADRDRATTIGPASSATSAPCSAATASTSAASRSAATSRGAVGVISVDEARRGSMRRRREIVPAEEPFEVALVPVAVRGSAVRDRGSRSGFAGRMVANLETSAADHSSVSASRR